MRWSPIKPHPLTNLSTQAFESGSPDLSARFFLLLTSSCAGLANPDITASESERVKFLRQASRWVERARERKCHPRKVLRCDALVNMDAR